jgi:hypothetical protein
VKIIRSRISSIVITPKNEEIFLRKKCVFGFNYLFLFNWRSNQNVFLDSLGLKPLAIDLMMAASTTSTPSTIS